MSMRKTRAMAMAEEAADIAAAQDAAVYLKPAPTNAELRKQFMSKEALKLKRLKPMFR